MVRISKVVFLGDAGAGKSSIIQKYVNPSTVIESAASDYFWDSPASDNSQNLTIAVDGQKVEIEIQEVSGSRGRMSNYYEISMACAKADLVVYCCSTNNKWTAESIDHIMTVANGSGKKKKQQKNIPYIMVETRIDLPQEEHVSNTKEQADKRSATYLSCSALSGENIPHVFEVIGRTVLQIEAAKAAKSAETEAEKKFSLKKLFGKLFGNEKKATPVVPLQESEIEKASPPAA